MSAAPRVVAIVAAKDRADSVGTTVAALLEIDEVCEVLVVDDGSTDATAAMAQRAGAWVLRLPQNQGKGGAVAAAVAATPETDIYLLVDADTGASAALAAALLPPVLEGTADMAVAVLASAGGRGGFGAVRRMAAAGIRLGAGGFRAAAPLSGQRAVRGPLLRGLGLASRFGLEVAMTVDAQRAGARIVEVPIEMQHRHTGRSLAGFAHRGRQGVDAVRAFWPRLTTARARVGLVALCFIVAVGAFTWSGGRWPPASVPPTVQAEKVLLVGVPGLRWDDVGTGTMPNLDRLVERGAVGAMNVRTGSPEPSTYEGYAALGAGSRARVGEAAGGAVARDGRIVVPGIAQLRAGAGRYLSSRPGALGDALHAAGRRTAVVGNADLAPGLAGPSAPGHPSLARPTAAALMDGGGIVDSGTVDPEELLAVEQRAPFGRRADIAALAAQVDIALTRADVVLVDPGDVDRAEALLGLGASESFVAARRAEAVTAADDLIGRISAEVSGSTLLLVVSVVPPGMEWRLTPVVAAGAGVVPGYLHSPSTKRQGLVTLTDVAPTILGALGSPVPSAMVGAPLRYHAAVSPDLARLARLDRDSAYRERMWLPVTVVFIAFQLVAWMLTALVLSGRLAWVRRSWLRVAALAVAAFAPATFLFRAIPFAPGIGAAGLTLLVATDVAIVALAHRGRRKALSPLAWIFGATVALLVLDVVTGARLQLGSILGYAPQTASRYSGLGNTGFAVLAAAAILAVALHVEHGPRRAEAVVTAATLLALVVFVDGSPALGNDVGGILTLAPVFTLMVMALAGRRLTWKTVAAAAAVTVIILGLATTVDLLRAPPERTHLGRLAAATLHRDDGSLVTTMARRASVDLHNLRQSVFTAVVPLIALGALVALRRRSGPLAELLAMGSPLRVGAWAALGAGLLGFVVNDSGVIVTAMVLVELGPLLALLALRDQVPSAVLLEPEVGATSAKATGPKASWPPGVAPPGLAAR